MSKKAVFLDRDGTLNVDKGYVYKINDLEFLDGAIEGLKLLQEKGYLLIIITNQSGIARGYYTDYDFMKFMDYMKNILRTSGINIDGIYYCPHLSGCKCRKPELGLFYKAIEEYDINVKESFAIGDKLRDLSICKKENILGFLIGNIDTEDKGIIECKNLYEAAKYIVMEGQRNG